MGEQFFETPYKNYYVSKSGKLLSNTRLGIVVKDVHFIDPYGYYRPAIMVAKGKQRRIFMHKLIMQTFVGECPKGYCIDHIDKNKLNNAQPFLFPSITKAHNFLGLNRHQYVRIKGGAKRVKQYTIKEWKEDETGVLMNIEGSLCSTTKADECKPVGDKPMIPQTVD